MLLWLLSVALFREKSIVYAVVAALASSLMICVFFIDIDYKIVFDRFVIMIGVLGLAVTFFDPEYGWLSHLIGGAIGFISFYLIAWSFEKLRGKEGLGGGDIKLTAACGLLLGWQRLLLSIVLATVSASIVLLIIARKNSDSSPDDEESAEYPFAPFLTSGFAIAMFFGESIIEWYLSLIGV
jgi:leader peptidase (prepilin peptidase)/N-methyltransferase